MGGYGSGLYGSGSKSPKVTVEECRSIDVRRWQREKLLKPGLSFTWHWRDDEGKDRASIGVITQEDCVQLVYRADGKPIRTDIQLSETKTGFGMRKWFHCPSCGGRVAILYLKYNYFKCRKCQELNYSSSQLSGDVGYYHSQLAKLCRKLGEEYDPMGYWPPDKPKGMHQTTYDRYRARYWQLVKKRDALFLAGMQRLTKGLP